VLVLVVLVCAYNVPRFFERDIACQEHSVVVSSSSPDVNGTTNLNPDTGDGGKLVS